MLHLFSNIDINNLVTPRKGESKLGVHVDSCNLKKSLEDNLANSSAKYVILGVPEDIGVKMNYGNGGAHTSFIPGLKAFLNTQQNQFINGKDILVLGYLDFLDEVVKFNANEREKGDVLVKHIDTVLSRTIKLIVENNKTPIIIGGGHNNAYGNIKGLSQAKGKAINAINLDAHTDLRLLEERHSGNGFSYAIEEGYLNKYFMFGLHANYTPQYIFDKIHNHINLDYNLFEEITVYQSTNFNNEIKRAKNFIDTFSFGVEIDLDCIQYFPSSAMTPSGFTPEQARQFVYEFGQLNNASYLHICEGAPAIMNNDITNGQVGKFISYLISDFIKAKEKNNF